MVTRALWSAVLSLAALGAAGCIPRGNFECSTDTECTSHNGQGFCEANGKCSFVDTKCESGRRYGEQSGEASGLCVTGATLADAAVDTPTSDGPTSDAAIDAPPSTCPAGYVTLSGSTHRYKLLTTAAGWTNQRSICGSEPANVYLTIPNDAAELDALVTFAGADFWVGISDAATEGTYVTVQSTAATFLPWAPGEPDNNGNQDCVRALVAQSKLETLTCGTPAIAVCECEP